MSDTIMLVNGVRVPAIGTGCAYGDWVGATDSPGFLPEKAWRGTALALEAGARHFDMALCYGTHRHVMDVVGQWLMRGDLAREDLFLTSKVAHPPAPPHVNMSPTLTLEFNHQSEEQVHSNVAKQIDQTLRELGVGYLDLLLVHWPGSFDNCDSSHARKLRRAVWSAFEVAYKRKQTRAIGVCNFSKRHLKGLIEDGAEILPMVNQIEVHPYCYDADLVSFCQTSGIVVTAYAPFASGAFGLLQDPVLVAIAAELGRSVGQVILRWLNQKGCIVLPKSSSVGRMKENQNIFDFVLSEDHVARIDGLHVGQAAKRSCPDPESVL